MTTLFVLTDPSQVETAERDLGFGVRSGVVLATDLATFLVAQRAKLRVRGVWEFLSAEDSQRTLHESARVVAGWTGRLRESTIVGGVCLADAAAASLDFGTQIGLNAALAAERILAQINPDQILAYECPTVPVIDNGPSPIEPASAGLFLAVFRWLAEQSGRSVRLHPRTSTRVRSRRWGLPKVNARPPSVKSPRPGDRVVLLMENGLRPQEAVELERRIGRRPSHGVIRVAEFNQDAVDWNSGSESDEEKRITEASREFAAGGHGLAGPLALFANPYFAYQFEAAWTEMRRAARLIGSFAALLDASRPAAVVLGHDAFLVERCFISVAQSRGVPVVSLLHSGLHHRLGYRFLASGGADRTLVAQREEREYLIAEGLAPDRIRVVGGHLYRPTPGAPSVAEKEEARKRLSLSVAGPMVVFLTAATSIGLGNLIADEGKHHETWVGLVDLARRRPEITFVIKPHPTSDYVDYYRELLRAAPANLLLRTGPVLDLVVRAADVAALLNYATSASVEAMRIGVPVVMVNTAIHPASEFEPSLSEAEVTTAKSLHEFEALFDEIVSSHESRKAAVGRSRPWFEELTRTSAEQAWENMVDEIVVVTQGRAASSGREPPSASNGREVINGTTNSPMAFANGYLIGLTSTSVSGMRSRLRHLTKRFSSADVYLARDSAYRAALVYHRFHSGRSSAPALITAVVADLGLRAFRSPRTRYLLLRAAAIG